MLVLADVYRLLQGEVPKQVLAPGVSPVGFAMAPHIGRVVVGVVVAVE